jgi:hypothetical protein
MGPSFSCCHEAGVTLMSAEGHDAASVLSPLESFVVRAPSLPAETTPDAPQPLADTPAVLQDPRIIRVLAVGGGDALCPGTGAGSGCRRRRVPRPRRCAGEWNTTWVPFFRRSRPGRWLCTGLAMRSAAWLTLGKGAGHRGWTMILKCGKICSNYALSGAPGSVRPQDIEDRVSQDIEDSHRRLPAWLAG